MQYETELVSTLPTWLLTQLRDQFRLRYFVETGTCSGRTTQLAALAFERVWTVEYCRWSFSEQVQARLGRHPNVEIGIGDSRLFLHDLFSQLDQPTLFFLDAHWSGQDDQRPPVECPLIDELAMLQLEGRHVVIVDDWALFGDGPRQEEPFDPQAWPTRADIREAATRAGGICTPLDDLLSPVLVIHPPGTEIDQ